MIDTQIILGFQSDNDIFYKSFYREHREDFVRYLIKVGLNKEQAIEVFHESILVLRKKAKSKTLENVSVSFKTYFYAIGKYKAYDLFKAQRKEILIIQEDIKDVAYPLIEDEDQTELIQAIKVKFKELGNSCRKLLTSFYLEGLSIKEITQREHYENENTVRAQKSRCLKQLKTLVLNGKER
ncbi:RNA polymerase sigma factor [Belliella kenyensis]|uniref:RNA polymerase sigma factor n=1 Tax=Belliella kenyensis TaxID=1472724 RepID=A0ABV8EQ14_9BACT|nr:sigma-70 family RNA polymerase sigma factor [Belliella kenyensis]MCH7402208.1 sigma-70 family RNA polymerase sigma factor [Belliella kenyensis]MDN3601722.1 sigma-70 family RNA polymerase sigma factor [Belliella kenyensis]